MINLDGKRKKLSHDIHKRVYNIQPGLLTSVTPKDAVHKHRAIETHSLFPVRYNSLLERLLLLYSSV